MRTVLNLIVITTITLMLIGCGRDRPGTPLLSTPPTTAVDNDVYVADDRGRIRALRPDGSEQWTVLLTDEINKRDALVSRDIRIDFLAARSAGKLFGLATQLTGSQTGGTILFALDSNHLLWELKCRIPSRMVSRLLSDLTEFMKQPKMVRFMLFPDRMVNKYGGIK